MPFTAFHVVPIWPLYVKWPHRWDVLALSFGAVMPDLEILASTLLAGDLTFGRGIMHSLLGVVTLNLLLALVAARFLAPWLATSLSTRLPSAAWRTFAHRDVISERRPWLVTGSSAIIGGLTHLAIDLTHHGNTPLLWPWQDVPIRAGPWAQDPLANVIANVIAGSLFVVMWIKWVGK